MEKQGSILVLAAGSLGDCILTLPALQALQTRFPVTVAGTSPYTSLGAGLLGIEKTTNLDPLLQGILSDSSAVAEVLEPFREVFVFFKEPDPALGQKLSRFGKNIHWPDKPFADFLKEGHWAGEYWLRMVLSGGSANSSLFRQNRLQFSPESLDRGARILKSLQLDSPFVIHPGSGSPRKNAPLSFFRKAAEKAASEAGKQVLVLWGEAEQGHLAEIQKNFSGLEKVGVLPEVLPLMDLAAVLRQSRGYLGNDSGVTHLASACGIRTFAVFQETDSRIWGPQEGIILESLRTVYS